jgi:hypothetical protein
MRVLVIGTTIDKPAALILHGLLTRGFHIHFLGTPIPENQALIESTGASITHHSFAHRFDLKGMSLIRKIAREDKIDLIYALSNQGLSCSVLSLINSSIPIATLSVDRQAPPLARPISVAYLS